ncbi:ATP-dependent DNA helicase UvrD2 [Nocardioides mangrovicus]|uniref:DNA 3'-5' helicase n=1 Tax=Nocardioides mangrovicus TaxID=2478913 RepID=A0A3L8P657_9ACTN|nr:ATP-dependent DNA helicase UvrD2 [Nocardioides mangrovicus]RLV50896.1 ATP-dependent DNA helicase UvrD2 [Nocardioides mangrovicus]
MPTSDDLLAALDPEQRAVAQALRGPVRVLAGAGTGKTRAITHRIAYGVATGVYDPQHVLAVTFTTRAAGEMRGRLRSLGAGGVQARTFHSAALRQVRYFWPRVYGGEPPELMDTKIPIVAAAARRHQVETDQARRRDVASEIEWAKVSNVRPEDYARVAPTRGREVAGLDHATVARLFEGYEQLKRDQGRMDMEDVLLCGAAILADDERVAAEIRRQYRFFVVDEFQDVSPIQSALLDLWVGGRDEICVVGDPAQTIYSFAGARASYLTDFPRRFESCTSVELVRNYRSTPQVLDVANRLLAGTATASVRLQSQRDAGPDVAWAEHPDEVAEADAVAREITRLRRAGVPLRETAVLFRINAQSEAFEEALTSAGIPYVVRGALRFFERQEVRQATALMRGAVRTDDVAGDSLPEQVRAVLSTTGWTDQAPTARGQARDRWESLQALVTRAEELAQENPAADLAGYVAELERRAHEQHAPVAEGVTLATLHTAKGLEWDAVFLCGLQEGSVPITYASTPAEVEEERRLLYVGVTRAREHLTLTWSLARNPGGQARRKPSRFLTDLLPAGVSAASVPGQRGAQRGEKKRGRRPATCRICNLALTTARQRNRGYCEDCPVPYDEELFASLRAWRKERAEADEVPAFVVFSDATLEALAEVRPDSREKLLRINGVGPAKVERYADDVLEILSS